MNCNVCKTNVGIIEKQKKKQESYLTIQIEVIHYQVIVNIIVVKFITRKHTTNQPS